MSEPSLPPYPESKMFFWIFVFILVYPAFLTLRTWLRGKMIDKTERSEKEEELCREMMGKIMHCFSEKPVYTYEELRRKCEGWFRLFPSDNFERGLVFLVQDGKLLRLVVQYGWGEKEEFYADREWFYKLLKERRQE